MRLGLSAALVAASWLVPQPSEAAKPRLWERLPPDAVVTAHADLAALRGTSVDLEGWCALLLSKPPEDVRAALASAGLRLSQDVDEIAFAVAPGRGTERSFAVLARGRFDRRRVRQAALAGGGLAVELPVLRASGERERKPSVAFVPAVQLPSSRPAYVSFVAEDVLVVASRDLTEQLAQRAVTTPSATARRVAADRASVAWIHAAVPSALGPAAGAAVALDGIRELTAWAQLREGLDVQVVATAADPPAAQQLATLVRWLAGSRVEPGAWWARVGEVAAVGDQVTLQLLLPPRPPAGS